MKGYRNESKRGWLVNQKRMDRRETDNTLTDKDVLQLIDAIDTMQDYTKSSEEIDRLIRLRDKAIIALGWMFFKRGNELLGVRVGQVSIVKFKGANFLQVQFHVQKKQKYTKFCPYCKTKKDKPTQNAKDANFCRNCGNSLSEVEAVKIGKDFLPVKKIKSVKDPFVKYILAWHEFAKAQAKNDDFLFPAYRRWLGFNFGHLEENEEKKRKRKVGDKKIWKEITDSDYHLSIQRLDQILQRLDPTLTSSMFRYGHTEVLFRDGYNAVDVKQIGDWSSTAMPEIYAARKGLTQAAKKFAMDVKENS
jgi:hypothetical protein